jgi:N-acetylneuraminate synthase
MIEFHLDLDETGEEYGTGHCWLPKQMESLIKAIDAGREADGSGIKVPAAAEEGDRDWRADPADGLRPCRSVREKWVAQ